MSGFCVLIYDDASDDQVGPSVDVGFLPYPGLVLITGEGAWRVERVQVIVPSPGSPAARGDLPTPVHVMATRTVGVHHADPMEGVL